MATNKNWKQIEEEFRQRFPFAIIDWKAGHENDSDGTATDKMKEILTFFKPYFQEKMHEISLRELEEEHPLYKKEYNELPEIVDNNPKE